MHAEQAVPRSHRVGHAPLTPLRPTGDDPQGIDMTAPQRQVRVIGARRERIDLRALADLLVAAADQDQPEHARDQGPTPRWLCRPEPENDSNARK